MNKDLHTYRRAERGSAIMWIFLAVALFAFLSFTVSNIMRGGNLDMSELARLHATDIIGYAGSVQRAVRVMMIEGVDESELCFHSENWGHTDYEFNPQCAEEKNQVFNLNGGGVSWQEGVADWYDIDNDTVMDSRTWVFSATYEVLNVGTDSGGPNSLQPNADLVMVSGSIKPEICLQINKLLGYNNIPVHNINGMHLNLASDKFDGDYGGGLNIMGDFGRERCVKSTATPRHWYYKVILAR